jgi:glycerol kinase
VRGACQQTFSQYYPRPGWVEHDAREILHTQLDCARSAIVDAGIEATDLAGLGVTNQRETTVLWERASGRPIAPAIVWQDRRTAAECDRLRAAGHADLVRERTGLELDAYFSATKLAWLLKNVPGARARADAGELAFGTVDTWLIWHLTGGAEHVTDPGNASRTMLFNINTLAWYEDLLALLDIPSTLLPRVVDSSGVCGHTQAQLFGGSIPIAGIAGDQQAATVGQACFAPGMAKNKYGTGFFLLMNTGDKPVASTNRLLSTVGWRAAGVTRYALEGSIFMGGAVVQWLRDGLGLIEQSEDVERLAASVSGSDGVILVPAFTGLGAPHWDPYARGTLLGLTRGSAAGHIARAALESIALQTVDLVDAMTRDGAGPLTELRVDGGAAANNLLMQMQADLLGVPVVRPQMLETTALGAAYLAGMGVGVWSGSDEVATHWKVDRRFEPKMSADRRDAMLHQWRRAIERAKAWAEA